MKRLMTGLTFLVILQVSSAAVARQVDWRDVTPNLKNPAPGFEAARYYETDVTEIRSFLDQVPNQYSGQSLMIYLPLPDGSLSLFSIMESPVMAPELAAKYPQIKSFKVYGIDDPIASGRVDISGKGFRAMLTTALGRVFIDPDFASVHAGRYISRLRQAQSTQERFQCSADEIEQSYEDISPASFKNARRIPGSFLRYRLAVSATTQYVVAVGGNQASTLAEINTAINRVNEIYERDFGIQFELVANNDTIIDVTGTASVLGPGGFTGGFANDNGLTLLTQNQAWVDDKIGTQNYDIGHIFSTGGGGFASIGSTCNDSIKAQGVTGLANPVGDAFYIDYVAHEIGHQFGAEHTFNGTEGSCQGNRNASTAFEPGSGSTIMSYAGLCDAEDIQPLSNATFHAGSIAQVNAFVEPPGLGSCGTNVAIANPAEPTASAGADFTIPASTPFVLSGVGSDADVADTLSYQWDQMDTGTQTGTDGNTSALSANLGDDVGDNALFRSYDPSPVAMRDLPTLGTQLNGQFDKSEVLPCTTRDLNFRLTVRDGKSGQATDDVRLSVDISAGPFVVTSHSAASITTIGGGSNETVTWNVANTDNATVNCATVDIDLLTFSAGHASYAVTSLATATANDGAELVTIPDSSNAMARFRVSCSNNIFYDISDADITINGTGTFNTNQFTTVFNNNPAVLSTATGQCRASATTAGTTGGTTGGNSSGGFNNTATGTGAMDKLLTLLFAGLLLFSGLVRSRRKP